MPLDNASLYRQGSPFTGRAKMTLSTPAQTGVQSGCRENSASPIRPIERVPPLLLQRAREAASVLDRLGTSTRKLRLQTGEPRSPASRTEYVVALGDRLSRTIEPFCESREFHGRFKNFIRGIVTAQNP
jgi:hypothetical protein